MKSHELLRLVLKKPGVKKVAVELKLSRQLVYKWQEPCGGTESGLTNPLDRTAQVYRLTRDRRLVEWLCAEADGFFVANPPDKTSPAKMDLTQAEAMVLRDEAELLASLAGLLAEKELSVEKVSRLRGLWERCKTDTERLVRSLERGEFRKQLMAWLPKFYPVCDVLTPGGLI